MKLTGIESTVLCFLARKPEYLVQFASALGPGALEVAQYLAGSTGVSAAARATGEAYCSGRSIFNVLEGKPHD